MHGELRRMQAMGRSLLLQREMVVSGRWWAESSWAEILQEMAPWVIAQLEIWKQLIEAIEERLRKIEGELRGEALRKLLFGEGERTHELLARELIDPERFRNSRQVANYFGLCPGESTSDQRRRLGPITKHGNPRLRRLLVELAWRVSRFQPDYRGLRRWSAARGSESLGGPPARKRWWPWRVAWPSTSGEWPPDECRLKNLAWCKKSGSTDTLSQEDPFAEQRNFLTHRRKPFGTAPPRHRL